MWLKYRCCWAHGCENWEWYFLGENIDLKSNQAWIDEYLQDVADRNNWSDKWRGIEHECVDTAPVQVIKGKLEQQIYRNRSGAKREAELQRAFFEAEFRQEIKELAQARDTLKIRLENAHPVECCKKDECPICGVILCPYDCEEHLWHDGCPCCYGTPVDPLPEPNDAS